ARLPAGGKRLLRAGRSHRHAAHLARLPRDDQGGAARASVQGRRRAYRRRGRRLEDHGNRRAAALTEFADVEQFGLEHGACGGITPSAAPHPGGGFVLSLTCACGERFERQVTEEQAKRPLPLPRPAARPAPPRPAPSADLEAVIRAAVEAEEVAPAPPRPLPPPVPPPAPRATAPARLNLDSTIKTALTEQSALRQKTAPRRPAPPRTRVAWLILFAVLA